MEERLCRNGRAAHLAPVLVDIADQLKTSPVGASFATEPAVFVSGGPPGYEG